MTDLPKFAGFRAEQRHIDKLRELEIATGLKTGDVLRALVEHAQLQPVTITRPVATLAAEKNYRCDAQELDRQCTTASEA